MDNCSTYFKNHHCFKTEWAGFDRVTPVTLIIGKNNTGKSHLLDLVRELTQNAFGSAKWDMKVRLTPHEFALQRNFLKIPLESNPRRDNWVWHGQLFSGVAVVCTRESGKPATVQLADERLWHQYSDGRSITPEQIEGRRRALINTVEGSTHPLHGRIFKRLSAERDIRIEPTGNRMSLTEDGVGATNIIRRFLNSSDAAYPREFVQRHILDALNEIFEEEARFTEITVQHHDGAEDQAQDQWEIFLGQEHKGIVSLSSSGSGLKTIFLVLLNLLLVPKIENKDLNQYVFAFEELENNLHPSLVRRLLKYICSKTDPEKKTFEGYPVFFLTTHSSVALDFFAGDKLAQIVHVSHDGRTGRTRSIDQTSPAYEVIWDLGTRPSDLLQANGVIWVEGPSDRIYLNRWIHLFSGGRFREGRHYQCAFYGGGLLANLEAVLATDDDAEKELINLLKINPNTIVISDSDRKTSRSPLKDRVKRIHSEFEKLDRNRTFHWILAAREIENYLLPEFLTEATPLELTKIPPPEQFESFFAKEKEDSYLESKLQRKAYDKVRLAALTAPAMTVELLTGRFDLDESMTRIIRLIETWNR